MLVSRRNIGHCHANIRKNSADLVDFDPWTENPRVGGSIPPLATIRSVRAVTAWSLAMSAFTQVDGLMSSDGHRNPSRSNVKPARSGPDRLMEESLDFKVSLEGFNRRKERVSIVIYPGGLDDDRSGLPFQEIVGLETCAFHKKLVRHVVSVDPRYRCTYSQL